MNNKFVKIAFFLLHSKALNAIINHIFPFAHERGMKGEAETCLFARLN